MSAQPVMDDMFDDGGKRGEELHTLFFALIPSDEAREQILALQKMMAWRLGLRSLIPSSMLHMTLCPAGQPKRLREPMPVALKKAASAIEAGVIDIQLASAARFGGSLGRPSWVLKTSDDATLGLRHALAKALLIEGLKTASVRGGSPHVTIAYSDDLPEAKEPIEPIRWTAREFVLIDSHFGKSRHDILGRWSLG